MNLEAEQHLLACALIDENHIVKLLEIPEEWFLSNKHKVIYREIDRLSGLRLSCDLFALGESLDGKEGFKTNEDHAYIHELANNLPNLKDFNSYKRILFDLYKADNIVKMAQNLILQVKGRTAIDEIINYGQEQLIGLLSDHNETGPQPMKVYMSQVIEDMQWQQDNPGKLRGKQTGFIELDNTINGFEAGKVYLIAARPGMGKSMFGLVDLGMRLSRENQVVAFSLEMTGKGLAQRAICGVAQINSNKINKADLTSDEWDSFSAATQTISERNKLYIDETPGLSTAQIRSRLKTQLLKNGKIGAIIIDHVGLIRKDPRQTLTQAMVQISHELAALAKEFDCPMIELSQLNRDVEKRPDKRPMMSDLKDTSALEEDARVIMMLYRDDYYNKENSETPGITEVNIVKNSDGETKTLFFGHDLGKATYTPIDGFTPPEQQNNKKGF
jgi:replicative DNA helicase